MLLIADSVLKINIITRKNLGAFQQEIIPQSASNYIRQTLAFMLGKETYNLAMKLK